MDGADGAGGVVRGLLLATLAVLLAGCRGEQRQAYECLARYCTVTVRVPMPDLEGCFGVDERGYLDTPARDGLEQCAYQQISGAPECALGHAQLLYDEAGWCCRSQEELDTLGCCSYPDDVAGDAFVDAWTLYFSAACPDARVLVDRVCDPPGEMRLSTTPTCDAAFP